MRDDIQVSVCVVTYNQEKYITECLDSIVSQKTDFNFEIIVGEDYSTDNTRQIVQQYADRYPDLIVPVFHEKNVGAVENIKQVYKKAKGKYIAHIDGDDLMLPHKLQKQFDMMEINSQAIICSHNMLEIINDNITEKSNWKYPKGEYTVLDLIKKLPFFAHSSKFFRNTDIIGLSNVLINEDVLDIEIHLYQVSKGSIIHIEESLGGYRVNVGISAIKNNKLNSRMIERIIYIYQKLLIIHPEFKSEINKSYSKYLLQIAYSYAVFESNGNKMKEYSKNSFDNHFFSLNQLLMLSLCIFPNIGIYILKVRNKIRN